MVKVLLDLLVLPDRLVPLVPLVLLALPVLHLPYLVQLVLLVHLDQQVLQDLPDQLVP